MREFFTLDKKKYVWQVEQSHLVSFYLLEEQPEVNDQSLLWNYWNFHQTKPNIIYTCTHNCKTPASVIRKVGDMTICWLHKTRPKLFAFKADSKRGSIYERLAIRLINKAEDSYSMNLDNKGVYWFYRITPTKQ